MLREERERESEIKRVTLLLDLCAEHARTMNKNKSTKLTILFRF